MEEEHSPMVHLGRVEVENIVKSVSIGNNYMIYESQIHPNRSDNHRIKNNVLNMQMSMLH